MLDVIFFVTALITTITGVAAFRRYGAALSTLDIPNERSSHTQPTLRGGGVVIVGVCLFLYAFVGLIGVGRTNWAFVTGAVIVAVVSWIDDASDLPAWVRFIAHSTAAVVLIAGSGAVSALQIPGYGAVTLVSWLSYPFTFLWVVWMINAYNFMDGIDGIAGAQGVVAGLGWAMLSVWLGDGSTYIFAAVIVFSSLGFLVHNWSPARVFMGDVGSAFLGYTFAAMPLLVNVPADKRPWLMTAAISFVWLFVFDSLFTLFRRILKREKVWLAHRKHIYQRLVIWGWSHSTVSLIYAALAITVSAAFMTALIFGGIGLSLLFFTYAMAPAAVTFQAFRKKV